VKMDVPICQYCVKRLDKWCYDYYRNPQTCLKMMLQAAEKRMVEGDSETALRIYLAMYGRGDSQGGDKALALMRSGRVTCMEDIDAFAEDLRFRKRQHMRVEVWPTPDEHDACRRDAAARRKAAERKARIESLPESARIAYADRVYERELIAYRARAKKGVFGLQRPDPINAVSAKMLSSKKRGMGDL